MSGKMSDNVRIDSHKLIYHPEAVARWMKGEIIYPIEIEISPSGACNHRCIFCALDYLEYQPNFLDKHVIMRDISHMSKRGLKSVVCAGEGEPLLNQEMPDLANEIRACGIDVAMSSNGVLFTKEKAIDCLGAFTWIRFSVASMEDKSYEKIQRGKGDDLTKVKVNLADAVKVKKDKKLKTTLGVQCLLLPENMDQLPDMAKQLKEIGIDYLTVKPYFQNLHSKNTFQVDYNEITELEQRVKAYADEDFAVYFRANAMKREHNRKCYDQCYGLPFMTHIDAKGNVWPCVGHIGMDGFCYGNIYEQTFEEIWEGKRRLEVINKIKELGVNKICSEACRLDEINKYLNELKHPGEHVNFI